jgi:hypothetical protein
MTSLSAQAEFNNECVSKFNAINFWRPINNSFPAKDIELINAEIIFNNLASAELVTPIHPLARRGFSGHGTCMQVDLSSPKSLKTWLFLSEPVIASANLKAEKFFAFYTSSFLKKMDFTEGDCLNHQDKVIGNVEKYAKNSKDASWDSETYSYLLKMPNSLEPLSKKLFLTKPTILQSRSYLITLENMGGGNKPLTWICSFELPNAY